MAVQLIFLIFMAIALAVVAAKAIGITTEGERLVVIRLGQMARLSPWIRPADTIHRSRCESQSR